MHPCRNVTEELPLRRFSLSEANRALVFVKRVAADVAEFYPRLVDLQEVSETAQNAGTDEQWRTARDELIAVSDRLRDCLDELDATGVELRDPIKGVVDFPGVVDAREVRLTWRLGDPRIVSWRELHSEELRSLAELLAPIDAAGVSG